MRNNKMSTIIREKEVDSSAKEALRKTYQYTTKQRSGRGGGKRGV